MSFDPDALRAKMHTPPEHLIALVAKHVPAPEQPFPGPWPTAQLAKWHRDECVRIATQIWAEAWHAGFTAGGAHVLATQSVKYMVVTEEEKARIVERMEAETKGTPS